MKGAGIWRKPGWRSRCGTYPDVSSSSPTTDNWFVGNLLRKYRVLALLLHLIGPSRLERDIFLVVSQQEHLITALRWIQAFVVCRMLEEAGYILGADPMTATRRLK
jgi:hypothetical protein